MVIMGVSEPVIIAGIVALIVFMLKVLPTLRKKKSLIDYDNFNMKESNAFWTYAGTGPAPSYTGIQLDKSPVIHSNGRATVWLEGIPNPLQDVAINEMDKDCDVMIKRTADALFGVRIDVLSRIDANGCRHEWDNVYVQNWQTYRDRFMDAAKHEIASKALGDKELLDELKGSIPSLKGAMSEHDLPLME